MAKTQNKVDKQRDHDQTPKILSQMKLKTRYTFNPTSNIYTCWQIVYLMACVYTTVVYPYYSVFEFPNYETAIFWRIMVSELACFIDIVLNFFKQNLDEQGQSKNENLETISSKYLNSNFLFDLFLIFPTGYVMAYIDHRLKFFWIIKIFRVK